MLFEQQHTISHQYYQFSWVQTSAYTSFLSDTTVPSLVADDTFVSGTLRKKYMSDICNFRNTSSSSSSSVGRTSLSVLVARPFFSLWYSVLLNQYNFISRVSILPPYPLFHNTGSPLHVCYNFSRPWYDLQGEHKKGAPPYDFRWYFSNAWRFLHEILHNC